MLARMLLHMILPPDPVDAPDDCRVVQRSIQDMDDLAVVLKDVNHACLIQATRIVRQASGGRVETGLVQHHGRSVLFLETARHVGVKFYQIGILPKEALYGRQLTLLTMTKVTLSMTAIIAYAGGRGECATLD